MRKTLIPMLVSLALCGGAAAAVIATKARAQSVRKPMMVALVSPGLQMAANAAPDEMRGREPQRPPAEMAARRKEICSDLYARAVGRLAYTETKLALTAAQQPLFNRWKAVRLGIARRRTGECGGGRMAQEGAMRPSVVDRMARREERLKIQLADLDSERPVLEALYGALSPQQKMALGFGDRPAMGRMFAGAQHMGHGFGGDRPMPDAPPSPEQ